MEQQNNNTIQINHSDLTWFIQHIALNSQRALMIHGLPGIGKSGGTDSLAKSIANSFNLKFSKEVAEDVEDEIKYYTLSDARASSLEPPDIRGLPYILAGGIRYALPKWLPKNPKSKGILFLDEMNLAPREVQSACYQLILDRRCGEYKLPDGWIIISAGNDASTCQTSAMEFSDPLNNRFVHLELLSPTADEWCEWAIKNDVVPDVIGFHKFSQTNLTKLPDGKGHFTFPTPRTWEFVSDQIKLLPDNYTEHQLRMCVCSAVGVAVGNNFVAFQKLKNQLNLEDLFEHPEKVKDIKGLDVRWSLISAVVSKYKSDKKLLPKILKLCEYLEPEFAIQTLKFLHEYGKNKFLDDGVKCKEWKVLSDKYLKFIVN